MRRFFAGTVRPFFLFTGAGTALVSLYDFFPSWVMPNIARLPYLQDDTIIIQHWGIMVVFMAADLIIERAWHLIQNAEFSLKAAKIMSFTVIQTIDFFLVGALGYITAIGIYNLFITNKEEQLLKRIKIEKLKDLEDKIIGVVVAALAVAFLGSVTDSAQAEESFYFGGGIALVISSLCLFMYFSSKTEQTVP